MSSLVLKRAGQIIRSNAQFTLVSIRSPWMVTQVGVHIPTYTVIKYCRSEMIKHLLTKYSHHYDILNNKPTLQPGPANDLSNKAGAES